MKKAITLPFILLLAIAHAQVAIGKTSLSGSGSLLEFSGNTASNQLTDIETINTKGLILPAVNSMPSAANSQNGTFVFDRQSGKNKFYENNLWKDMSDEGSSSGMVPMTGSEVGDGVIIGSGSSSAKGVLIFESPDKALVLPHIKNPHLSVQKPYPGMICYDTVSNSIAVYDGVNWNYWK
ncbi:hypothetical protein ODZ84_22980 [Chryseobacterium fluminis]|uniref:hypothetical protein n=1 Tax=Chryseobacterium fluminis TaxID=2983606 RepID=UPI0022544652|nr:hypothetical protein [Chryseobacterium sp. MMS21-Ot14]UZT97991.1 hypothetical protein ODZ84_22980 [Chryseobacterium sp. MMS21-Ot14]